VDAGEERKEGESAMCEPVSQLATINLVARCTLPSCCPRATGGVEEGVGAGTMRGEAVWTRAKIIETWLQERPKFENISHLTHHVVRLTT